MTNTNDDAARRGRDDAGIYITGNDRPPAPATEVLRQLAEPDPQLQATVPDDLLDDYLAVTIPDDVVANAVTHPANVHPIDDLTALYAAADTAEFKQARAGMQARAQAASEALHQYRLRAAQRTRHRRESYDRIRGSLHPMCATPGCGQRVGTLSAGITLTQSNQSIAGRPLLCWACLAVAALIEAQALAGELLDGTPRGQLVAELLNLDAGSTHTA